MNKTSLILWNVANKPAPTDFMDGVKLAIASLEKPVSQPDILFHRFAFNMVRIANALKGKVSESFYNACLNLPQQVKVLKTEALEIDVEQEDLLDAVILCGGLANQLDFACFSEAAIMLFWPDGTILPPDRAEEWRAAQAGKINSPQPKFEKTVTAYRKHLEPMISNMLEKHGFKFQSFDDPDFCYPSVDLQLEINKANIIDKDSYKKQIIEDLINSKESQQFCYVKQVDYGEICVYFRIEEGKYNIYIYPKIYFHVKEVYCILENECFNNFYWAFEWQSWKKSQQFSSLCMEIEDDFSATKFLDAFSDWLVDGVIHKAYSLKGLEEVVIEATSPIFFFAKWAQLLCLDHINGGMHADMFKDVGWYFASGIKKEDWSTEWPKLIEYVKQFKL